MKYSLSRFIFYLFSLLFFTQTTFAEIDPIAEKKVTQLLIQSSQNRSELLRPAINQALTAYSYAENISDTSQIKCCIAIANLYNDIGNYDSSLYFSQIGKTVASKINSKSDLAAIYNAMGVTYINQLKFKQAMQHYFLALKIFDELKMPMRCADEYSNIAYVHSQMGNFKESRRFQEKALHIYQENKYKKGEAQSYNNLGILFAENGRLNESLYFFKLSKNIREKINSKSDLCWTYNNIGGIYTMIEKYDSGLYYLNKAAEQFKLTGNTNGMAAALGNIGSVNKDLKKYKEAIVFFHRGLNVAKENKYYDLIENTYAGLIDVYKLTNNYKTALLYADSLVALKDSIYDKESSKKIAEMQALYETEKASSENKLLAKENTIQKLEIGRRKIYIITLIVLFILITIIYISYYNRYKFKKESQLSMALFKQREESSKEIIKAEENERRRIATDLHDGLGQLFSAVKLNLSGISDNISFNDNNQKEVFEKTLSLVDESCKEIREISHAMMPNVLLKSGLASAIRNFIQKIDHQKLKVNLETTGLDQRLNPEVETILYRVIQECINNVIKHSKANQLDIQLIKDEDGMNVTIEDNGVGFDKNTIQSEGLGLKNIYSRINYLNGTVEWDSAEGKGTLVAIFIP